MTAVALYCRVSTEEQSKHGVSLKDQEERLRKQASIEKWDVADVYIDEGISGGTDQRPHLQNLMLDARAHRFDLVIVTKIDRFFRNVRLLLNAIEQLKQSGVDFIALADNVDTRDKKNGNMVLNVLATMAEWERTRIGERISDFRQHLASKGRWSSGRPPFGYRFNKNTKNLDIYEAEASAIRYAFEQYTGNEPIGIIRLAERMNKAGYMPPVNSRKNPKHDYWTQTTVRHILTHPAYMGGPNNKWHFITPAIVSPDIWQSVQRRLSTNRHFKASKGERIPFQGRLQCGLCGHTLRIGYSHGNTKVFECPGRLKSEHLDGSPRCTLPRFTVDKLGDTIARRLIKIASRPDEFIKLIQNTLNDLENESAILESNLHPIEKALSTIAEDMTILDARLEMRRITPDVYKSRVAQLQRKQRDLEKQKDSIDPCNINNLKDNTEAIEICNKILQAINQKEYDSEDAEFHILSTLFAPSYEIELPESSKLVGNKLINSLFFNDLYKSFTVFPNKVQIRGRTIGKLNLSTAYRLNHYQ